MEWIGAGKLRLKIEAQGFLRNYYHPPATMDTFLQNFGQHATSFLNLMLMKRLDTGDRMMDTTLQMLLSTVLGGLISGLIAIYTKGLWADAKNRAMALWNSKYYDPLRFDPRTAPEKPANGVVFQYKSFFPVNNWTTLVSWLYTNHADKLFPQKLDRPLLTPSDPANTSLLDRDGLMSANAGKGRIPSNVYFPIWRTRDGKFVYLTTGGSSFYDDDPELLSDSIQALQECAAHIRAHNVKVEDYMKEKRHKKGGECHHLFEMHKGELVYPGADINKKKTFDTLFFTQKGEVMRILARFKEGNLFAEHMPIDNKLGFLLHGPPGTGKTGFIAAVANFLGRDVINVDTSRIKTRKELNAVLNHDPKKFIYIFEEFDCMPGVGRRMEEAVEGGEAATAKKAEEKGMSAQEYAMFLMAQKDKSEAMMEEYREEKAAAADKLDLGYLLRKLDGLESGEGRIIIATTNHPERIDPALLRPGRFGIQLHLTRCTRPMLRDIVGMIYQLDAEKLRELELGLGEVPDLKWAPAEVLQLGVTLPGWMEMMRHLREKEPGELV